jgi:RNA polymerase sigma-70 factor (ECF subfamily)
MEWSAAEFEQVVREHQAWVFSLALRFLRDRGQAEEVAQDVFIRLYQHGGEIESAEHLRHWLRQVTVRRAVDVWRARRRRPELVLLEAPVPCRAPSPGDVLLQAQLRELVGRLPAASRLVMVLRYQEGLQPREIARTLSIPVNTVKSRINRSVSWLRARTAGAPEVAS